MHGPGSMPLVLLALLDVSVPLGYGKKRQQQRRALPDVITKQLFTFEVRDLIL